MVTCYLRYEIDPYKKAEFEHYGQLWIPLVERYGGVHHGYFLPYEGANNIAVALFTFASLAAYETYRDEAVEDPDCQLALGRFKKALLTICILNAYYLDGH